MTTRTLPATPGRRTPADVARGLAAAVVLTVFVIGVPAGLLAFGTLQLPDRLPTWDAVTAALTRPDDSTLLLAVIQLIGWTAWAAFTAAVIVETIAVARRVSTPTIPALRGMQHLAAHLLAAITLLAISTTPTAPANASSITAAAAHPAPSKDAVPTAEDTAASTATQAAPPARREPSAVERAEAGPVITVVRGDTLWDLAQRHLGDGHRYTEIVDLNVSRPQPDGRALDEAHWIYPGWRLQLPADATDLPEPRPTGPDGQVYTVQPGDTLWDIAAEQLGDPHRYPDIVELNQGRPQPDAATLTDPDLIRPGWALRLEKSTTPVEPTAATPEAPTTSTPTPVEAEAPAPAHDRTAAPLASPNDARTGTARIRRHLDDAAANTDDAARTPDDAPSTANDAPPETTTSDDALDDGGSVPLMPLGLTALAAAGFIGELIRRRMLQRRTRRTGQRIPLPAPGSVSGDAERTLRETPPSLTIPALKQALLNLASRCYTAERDLPPLAAITITPTAVRLHLNDHAEPVAPFIATGTTTWTAEHSAIAGVSPIEDPGRPEPYPALITLGHTDDGTVLLNLEAAGTLTLTGDRDTADDVLRALVAELATSDLTGRIGLITGPEFADLAAVCDRARLQITTTRDLDSAVTARSQQVSRTLADAGVEDTLQARSDRVIDDTWLPVVYVSTEPLYVSPWSGCTVLAIGPPRDDGWTLHLDDAQACLTPLGLTLQPQRLTSPNYATLVELLRTADTATQGVNADETLDDAIVDAFTVLPTPSEPDCEDAAGLVQINVLGPIAIDGLPETDKPLSPRSTELLVYLALRGQATGPELDEALWHGRRIEPQTRNSLVYRTRQRVGATVLPVQGADGLYRLGASVTIDWAQFQTAARRGLAAGRNGMKDLERAMALVRDRPLLGVRDHTYTWAEHDIQQMISTIADVGHVLARLLLEAGQHRNALIATSRALLAEPCSEDLMRDSLAAARMAGDTAEVARLTERFRDDLEQLDPDNSESAWASVMR